VSVSPGGRSLRRSVLSGLAWKGASQVTTQITRFAVAIVLARLLSPHDYGIAAMVLVFMSFVLVFSDFALGNALVQREDLSDEDCSTAFWTSVAAGALFTVLAIAAAGPVASFFGEPALRAMIVVLAFSFIIQSLGITQSALLVRRMEFRGLEVREMGATLVGGAVGIAVALRGGGAWAIIAQQLAAAAATTLLVWRYTAWWPGFVFSVRRLRSFAGFSANVLGTNVLNQLRGTTDNLLVGRVLGPSALGAYGLAYNLVLVPFNRIAVPLSQVLFPALARMQDDRPRIAELWKRSLRLIAGVAAPCCVGLVFAGPEFVEFVLGNKWSHAVRIVQLLAVVGLLQTLQFLNPIVLQSLNRTSTLLRWTLFSYAASVCAFAIGLHWGAVGVAAAYAIVSAVTEPLYARATARAVGLPFAELARAVAPVLAAAAVMAAAMGVTRIALATTAAGPGLRLGVLVVVGLAALAGGIAWRAPQLVRELRALVRRGESTAAREPQETAASNVAASSAASVR
jgi:PST family polysaccharide transporter